MSLSKSVVNEIGTSERVARILSYIFDGTFISVPILIAISLIVVEDKMIAIGWASISLFFGVIIPFLYRQ